MAIPKSIRVYMPVFFGVCLLFGVIMLSKPLEVYSIIKGIKLQHIILVFISVILTYVVQTLRFLYLAVNYGERIGFFMAFKILVSAACLNLLFPAGGGDVLLRPYLLKKINGHSFRKCFVCVFFERVIDLLVLLGFVLVSVYFLLPSILLYTILIFLTGITFGALIFFLPMKFIPSRVPSIVKKYVRLIRRLRKLSLRVLIGSLLLSALNFIFLVINVILVLLAFDISPDFKIIGAIFISAVAGILSLIPAGLGVTDGSVAGIFYLMGLSPSLGVSIALVNRFVILSVSLFFALSILPRLKKVAKTLPKPF